MIWYAIKLKVIAWPKRQRHLKAVMVLNVPGWTDFRNFNSPGGNRNLPLPIPGAIQSSGKQATS